MVLKQKASQETNKTMPFYFHFVCFSDSRSATDKNRLNGHIWVGRCPISQMKFLSHNFPSFSFLLHALSFLCFRNGCFAFYIYLYMQFFDVSVQQFLHRTMLGQRRTACKTIQNNEKIKTRNKTHWKQLLAVGLFKRCCTTRYFE